jgi:TonB family protein
MTTGMWLRNLLAFGMQSGLLVGGGILLMKACRLDEPRVSLAYWRALLLACLLLPFCQPWQTVSSNITAAGVGSPAPMTAAGSTLPPVPTVLSQKGISPERLIVIVLGAGAALRAMWLAIGAWTLARIRRQANRLDPLPEAIARAQEQVGVSAAMALSDRVAGPITFGLRRPVVVFPPAVIAMAAPVQHAIACHELLHVRRRDWVVHLVEEAIRTIFWFHPGVWWLVDRIQLTREQVVDQESIALVDSRDRYVEALLAVAIARSPRLFTPAPAFFRRSLLKKRVAQILQEKTMTTRRLMISIGASAAALALAATVAVRSFPLYAEGQARSTSSKPVEIVKGGEHLLHGELPEYPRRAIDQKVEGDVLLDIAVDDQGEVSDARVLSGPDDLRKAALGAVLGWHYSPASLRSASTQATIRFTLAVANATYHGVAYTTEMKEPNGELTNAQRLERMMTELQQAMKDPNLSPSQRDEYKAKAAAITVQMAHIRAEREAAEGRSVGYSIERKEVKSANQGPLRLVKVESERVAPEAVSEVLKRAGLKVGDPVTEDSLKVLRAAAAAVDEHFTVVMHTDGRGGASVVLVSRE